MLQFHCPLFVSKVEGGRFGLRAGRSPTAVFGKACAAASKSSSRRRQVGLSQRDERAIVLRSSASSEDDASGRSAANANGWNEPPRQSSFEVADAITTRQQLEPQVPTTFTGFSITAMHTLRHLESLSLRNIALNCTEAGISALLLLGTLSSESSLGISERLLYIVSCTSSAGYLWVARKHFQKVKPYSADGLTLTLAGIKDMNVLFSNFAFVVSVRGLCQVMEAAQADPDLVFKLQALGMVAATVKIALTQGLLSAQTVQDSAARTAESSPNTLEALNTQIRQGPFGTTAVPDVAGAKSAVKLSSTDSDAPEGLPKAVRDISLATIDVNSPHLTTLLPMKGRPLATSFVQSLGLSVDEGDSCKSKQSQAAPAEYEIIGADEQVLKENMEQLNVSAGCMLVLCISTCLLAEATELPAVVGHLGSLEELVEHAPALLSLCVDFSEQAAMTIALASARNSFRQVVETSGKDITCLMDGLSVDHGLGKFLEAWAVVQCGIIATMLSQLIVNTDALATPVKEVVRVIASDLL